MGEVNLEVNLEITTIMVFRAHKHQMQLASETLIWLITVCLLTNEGLPMHHRCDC